MPIKTQGTPPGFTLTEIIVVMLIFSVIAVFSMLFIVTGVSSYMTTQENTVLAQKVGNAMLRISTELLEEMTSIDTLVTGISAENAHIKYGCDTGNCVSGYRHLILLGSGERKRLVLADQAEAPDGSSASWLLDNVSGFTIEPFSDCAARTAWSVGEDLADLACVEISITVFISEVAGDTHTETFTTTLRPMRENDVI